MNTIFLMDKKGLIVMGAIILACVFVIFALNLLAVNSIRSRNGFLRHFVDTPVLIAEDTLDLGYDSYYLAGHTTHTVYMGNLVAPRHFLSISLETLDPEHMEFKIAQPRPFKMPSIQVAIDSPYIYLCEGTAPAIYKGDLNSLTISPREIMGTYFLDVVPTGNSTFMIRSLNHARESMLGRLVLEPFRVAFPPIDLKKQIDGFFCTDGKMHYDEKMERLVYVYTYRNRILILDSALNVTAAGKTIDTISHARIKVAKMSFGNTVALSSPPMVVNRNSSVYDNWLFVNSDLVADNENAGNCQKCAVVDVYELPTLRYKCSFYIPGYAGTKINDFAFFGSRLLAQYESKVIFFKVLLKL